MSLPLWKLGTLAVKSVSKSVAGRLKQQAAIHPRFRQMIVNMAQTNHKITTHMQRRIYGHATDVAVRPLNEEKAIQSAVDLIGEVFVFSIAGALVIFEVHRSARSEARKEELRKHELEALKQLNDDVKKELENCWPRLRELEKLYGEEGLNGILNVKQGNAGNGKTEKAA